MMQIVGIKFNSNAGDIHGFKYNGFVPGAELAEKVYYFRAYEEYSREDVVVVDTALGFKIGEVVETWVQSPSVQPVREVVCCVNICDWARRKDARERQEKLKKQMDAKIAKMQAMLLYEQMAQKDGELADMLAEYKALGGELK